MGIDVYLRWPNQTKAEENAQFTGFNIDAGHVGYLREAYHGGPYATGVLIPEGFAEPYRVEIKAATLRERLPATLAAARERQVKVYNNLKANELREDDVPLKAFCDFVALAERMEERHGSVTVVVSA